MNYKKFLLVVAIFSIVALCMILFVSIYLTLAIAHKNELAFCFSPGCFDFAAKAFQEPIKILKVGIEFGAYAFTGIGAAMAILTYINSVRSEKNNRHFLKHSEFKVFTSELVAKANSGIKPENFNTNKYYRFLFPLSSEAYFAPAESYANTINCIEAQIAETQIGFIPGDPRSIEVHCKNMLGYFQALGITIEEPTEESVVLLEPKIFIFIDSINQQFTDIDISLKSMARDYSRSLQ